MWKRRKRKRNDPDAKTGPIPPEEWIPDYPIDSATLVRQGTPYDELSAEQQQQADDLRAAKRAKEAEPHEPTSGDSIKPSMTEQELRDEGVAIDVPFEGASAAPQPLRYGRDDDGELERQILRRIKDERRKKDSGDPPAT